MRCGCYYLSSVLKRIRDKIKELGRLTPLALLSAFLPIVGSMTLIIFILPIGEWLKANWHVGMLVFIAGTMFLCGLALLPTNVIGIVSGWAFSFELGLLVLMIGVVGSAVLSFYVNRRLSGEHLSKAIERHPRSSAIYNALLQDDIRKTVLIIVLLRMSVIMPFALTNFLMAAARVSLKPFLIGTALGMLPRSAAMVFVGSGLSELDLADTRETAVFFVGVAATVASVVTIAVFSRKALLRMT
jgi:uncharacterized membrane protein YdjX (TVP38/TMEM64 family)